MIRLFNCDALEFLKRDEKSWDVIFMDPPDNLGLKYIGFVDKRDDYYEWLELMILESMKKCKVLWLSYYWKHDITLKWIVYRILRDYHPSWSAKGFIWKFNFGQHNKNDCGSGFRNILRLSSFEVKWRVNEIKVESERQRLGDKRAKDGKVPLDVWEFSRVVNSQERKTWHPTQHPEGLVERMYSMYGKTFCDLFVGSGTSIRVCKKLGLDLDCCEISKYYCERCLL